MKELVTIAVGIWIIVAALSMTAISAAGAYKLVRVILGYDE